MYKLAPLQRSAAELLALTLKTLFPKVMLVKGGNGGLGFYYDFIFSQALDDQAIPLIEEKMRALVKSKLPIRTSTMMRKNAVDFFHHHKLPQQAEMLEDSEEALTEICTIEAPKGEFYDIVEGPLVEHSGMLAFFKILTLERRVLDSLEVYRIQGVLFPEPQSLKKFLKRYEFFKKCNHLLLGNELNLYSVLTDQKGEDSFLWHLKGEVIRERLKGYWREMHRKLHFQLVSSDVSPDAPPDALKENHQRIFQASWSELSVFPVKIAQLFAKSQHLKDTEKSGLLFCENFTADLAHLFCDPDQLQAELEPLFRQIAILMGLLKLEFRILLAPRPKKSLIDASAWREGEEALKGAMQSCGLEFEEGDPTAQASCPKAIFLLQDLLGRDWEGSFLGVDYATHITKKVAIISFSLFGSLERLIAIMLEQHGGRFPFWIAPDQIRIVPVEEAALPYAEDVLSKCLNEGFRAAVDRRSLKLGMKIHAAEKERVPYIVIVGQKEQREGQVTIRPASVKQTAASREDAPLELTSFLAKLRDERESKSF